MCQTFGRSHIECASRSSTGSGHLGSARCAYRLFRDAFVLRARLTDVESRVRLSRASTPRLLLSLRAAAFGVGAFFENKPVRLALDGRAVRFFREELRDAPSMIFIASQARHCRVPELNGPANRLFPPEHELTLVSRQPACL